jgi:PTH1 family peptidyl-tRNA hydrolase
MILDQLASRKGASFQSSSKWDADVASHEGVHFCKPSSYMNLSGGPVSAISQFYKVPANEVLVVLDDVALPLGQLRFRAGGSAGGHNGLKSIIEHFGTQEVPRLRFGVGAVEGEKTLSDHVLGRFTKAERPILEESTARAVAAIEAAQESGLQAAMNTYNQTQGTKS